MLSVMETINFWIVLIMTILYFHQFVYTAVGIFAYRAKPLPPAPRLHRFAVLVAARNESAVIAELLQSLRRQRYPQELLDLYVLADNCTDDTAERARKAGARVFCRCDPQRVGKGWALDELLHRIKETGERYDGYFVFDADNIVHPDFVQEMNKVFCKGFQVVTSYRNSKNFGQNWITAGYAIWFLREARCLNFPRMLLGTSAAVSGTGFLMSEKIVQENGGWPFHLLTEDIQFSADCIARGVRIGYADHAMIYDEQPVTFRQAWRQRLRWSKGFLQVDASYIWPLTKGIFRNKGSRFACYDMLTVIAPGILFSVLVLLLNVMVLVACLTQPQEEILRVLTVSGRYLLFAAINFYVGLFLVGLITVITEWKLIEEPTVKKLCYLPLFPIYMATYAPIALAALFCHVEWKPIEHGVAPPKKEQRMGG